ncbi:MAG: hypothetical protein ACRDHP_02685 [Ktedonobacterales bacterium]
MSKNSDVGAVSAHDALEDLFGFLAASIPTSTSTIDSYPLSADVLPAVPSQLQTDRLYILKGVHEYNECFRADVVTFFAKKDLYRQLALLILAVLFASEPTEVTLRLTHAATEIQRLIIAYDGQDPNRLGYGYHTRPHIFLYHPSETRKSPWFDLQLAPADLPYFYLVASRYYGDADENWRRRDTIRGFGTDQGFARLAELFLNASRPESALTEYELEGDAGYRGVGPMSAEARFILPGSVFWDPGQWPAT